jgi:hypothetical protein
MSSSLQSPGTAADDSATGTVTWNNVDSAKVSDNFYAYASFTSTATSHYLKMTNFGFSIPTGATIFGILVEKEQSLHQSDDYISDNIVSIVKADGSIGSTNKAIAGRWLFAESYISHGGSTDLWGESWTPADINDADFGVAISINGQLADLGSSSSARIDHVRITVYYGYYISAGVGTFVLTGISSGFIKALNVLASVGTFTLTGITTTFLIARRIVMDVGSFTLTGIATLFKIGKGLVAETGTFVLTGIDALIASARTLALAVGSFTLTGIATLFNKAITLTASLGTFILTLKDAILPSTGWSYDTKPTTSFTNDLKSTTSFTNDSKSTTSWTEDSKPTTSFTNDSKSSTSWSNDSK